MIYFKEDYVTVKYNEALNLVEIEWYGLVLSNHYRETLNMVLDLINEKKVKRFLVDRTHMERITLADEQWREKEWYPRFLKSTIKRSASVISKDHYTEVSVSRLIEEKDKNLRIERKRFYDQLSAKEWLLQDIKIEK